MKQILFLAVAALAAAMAPAQSAQPAVSPTISLDFTNQALVPAHWTLEIHPNGSGHFRSERGLAPRADGEWIEPPDLDRSLHVSAAFAQRVFATAQALHYFQKDCDSHAKVAFTGTKKLRYSGNGVTGSCAYNYAKDKAVQGLGDQMQAVAATLIEAGRIERLRQHDKLGLDKAMQDLAEMSNDGRAAELCVIHDELASLVNDEALMERVRKRARELLAKAGE